VRKIKEVLRLRYELKLDQRQIARSCSVSVSTVHQCLKRAERSNIQWPLPDGWDDARLEAALYPPSETKPKPERSVPDFAAVHEQLRTHRHLTLQLLWEEYREANPDGYRYSRYVAAVFMLPWDAGPQAFCSSAAPCCNINRACRGYRPFKKAINEGRCVGRGSVPANPLISTLASAVAFISISTSAYTCVVSSET
jgi:hypothetical protein